jgi:hypothetical protein
MQSENRFRLMARFFWTENAAKRPKRGAQKGCGATTVQPGSPMVPILPLPQWKWVCMFSDDNQRTVKLFVSKPHADTHSTHAPRHTMTERAGGGLQARRRRRRRARRRRRRLSSISTSCNALTESGFENCKQDSNLLPRPFT